MEAFPEELLLQSVLAAMGVRETHTKFDESLSKLRRSLDQHELELHELKKDSPLSRRNLELSVALSSDEERRAAFNSGNDETKYEIASSLLQEIGYGSFKHQDFFEEGLMTHPKPSQNPSKIVSKPLQIKGSCKCSHENKKSF